MRVLLVIVTIVTFAAGDVLARGKGGNSGGDRGGGERSSASSRGGGGGGGGGRSFSRSGGGGGGGGQSFSRSGGGSSSSRSFSGGSSRSHSSSRGSSFSGGGGAPSRSRSSGSNAWSGNSSSRGGNSSIGNNSFYRSRSSSDGPALSRRDLSGGASNSGQSSSGYRGFNRSGSTFGNVPSGGDAGARARAIQAYQAQRQRSGGNNSSSFEQFRSRGGGNDDSAARNYAERSTSQLRTFNERSSSGNPPQGYSRYRDSNGRLDSDQLRALLNQRNNQSSDRSQADSDRAGQFRQLDWNARRSDLSGSRDGNSGGDNVRGRGGNQALEQALRNRNLRSSQSGSDGRDGDFRRNWNRSDERGNLSGNDSAQRAFRDSQRGQGDRNRGGDLSRFDRWSKNSDGISAKTRRWYGNSGFGDHRDRSDRRRGDVDNNFANQVRKNWRNHWNNDWRDNDRGHRGRNLPFAYSWWNGRHGSPFHVHWRDNRWRSDPYYWWHWSTAPRLTSWVSFGWYEPCYWDYGPGEYVYYRDNYVYVDNQLYGTALDYYAQVRALAQGVPAFSPEQWATIDWLPLGVFAVTRGGAAASQEIVQLAVSQEGILSGTLFDERTGTARPLKGMVDQATQRAAWVLADAPSEALVVETSLYNLTEPQCTALAHLGPVSTEVWQLVRLETPTEPGGAAAQPLLPVPGQ